MTNYLTTTTVFATTEVIGFHQWSTAPDEVAYLRARHRHKFGIRVELSVVENDREVEFHMLRRKLQSFMWAEFDYHEVGRNEVVFGAQSCESIAHTIVAFLIDRYPDRDLYRVTVDEDGENGATVTARA